MRLNFEKLSEFSEVIVVFEDENSLWWLHFLKKGFRHCYLLFRLDDGHNWLEINPMSNQLFIWFHTFDKACDYAELLRCEGKCRFIRQPLKPAPCRCAPAAPFTCVEFVKRTLGIHDFAIITPYQLYKKLKSVGKKS